MRRARTLFAGTMLFVALAFLAGPGARAQDQSQSQSQSQPQEDQNQPQKDQPQPKKKGGFFKGLKAVTGQSSEQTEDTAAAGSKSVGEGAQIAAVTPTAQARGKVTAMENYSVPDKDLKKFQEDGKLVPKQ
jgi:hypothetical protein